MNMRTQNETTPKSNGKPELPMDERIHKALTNALFNEWKNDKSSKVIHKEKGRQK
jgi:hypothetical protein